MSLNIWLAELYKINFVTSCFNDSDQGNAPVENLSIFSYAFSQAMLMWKI